jgi:hypothetical protein
MTLDEYRATVLGKLKVCHSHGEVLATLAELDLRLTNARISDQARKTFWENLNNELDALSQETASLPGKQTATTLSAVTSAAQTVIEQYLLLLASES